jgi:hypothetical protein
VVREVGLQTILGLLTGVERVLDVEAWTPVGAFITSRAYSLWHLLPPLTGRQRE